MNLQEKIEFIMRMMIYAGSDKIEAYKFALKYMGMRP